MKDLQKSSFVCLSILMFTVFGCNPSYKYEVEKSANGITIHQDSTLINIQVVNASIIHVKKMIEGSDVSKLPDYVTILEPQNVPWELVESENMLTLSTDAL